MCISVALLTLLHISYKKPRADSALDDTPLDSNINVSQTFKTYGTSLSETRLAYVGDHDLFNPTRGVDPNKIQQVVVEKTIKQNQLEVMGLFQFGKMKGAIIASAAARSKNNLEKKQFYTIGEKIAGTSYILQDVKPEEQKAIVSLGATQYVLKLEQDDKSSEARRKAAVAASNERIRATNSQLNMQTGAKPPNLRNNKNNKSRNVRNVRNARNVRNVRRVQNTKRPPTRPKPMTISGRQRINFKRK